MRNDTKALAIGLGALLAGGAAYYGLKEDPARAKVVVLDDFDMPFSRMQSRMNRLLAEMDRDFEEFDRAFMPPANVRRARMDAAVKDGKFRLVAEMPGIKKDDIDISAHDGLLTVKGERKAKADEDKDGYYIRERSASSFSRTVSLPEGADIDKAETSFSDGVLTITMPVKGLPKPQVRKLAIK
ncbi:MAG: Hsp20/alpha crystallin family protein [Rickettsiales bacterium]|jgi:HSP20 family protein|nr:Hsp20/alpha crystallin family protein [Rickettsiales bacterium]